MNRWRMVAQHVHEPVMWLALLGAALWLWRVSPAQPGWLLVLPLAWGLRWLATGRPAPRTPLDGPVMVLALLAGVSLWVTPDAPLTLIKVAGVWLGVSLFYHLVAWIGTRAGRLRWATVGLLLLTSGLAGVGLLAGGPPASKLPVVAWLTAHWPTQLASPQGFANPLGALVGAEAGVNPNEVAGVVLWVAPLWLAVLAGLWLARPARPQGFRKPLRSRWRWRAALGAALLGALATALILLVTQSRSGLLGYSVGLIGLACLGPRRWQDPKGFRNPWGLLLWLGCAAAGLAAGWQLNGWPAPWAEPWPTEATTTELLSSRPEIWARAVYVLEDFPLTGLGMNMFRRLGPILYPYFRLSNDLDLAHAHNQWLQAGVDLGLPGLVALLALWWGAGLMMAQAYTQARTPARRWLAAGVAASLLASFVFGLTDAVALGARSGVMWWWLLAVGVGLAARIKLNSDG